MRKENGKYQTRDLLIIEQSIQMISNALILPEGTVDIEY